MAAKKMRPTRYAHYEGHTDMCYTDDGRYIITCGTDGEVRIFEGLDDDDCKTHVVAESAHAIAYRDGRFLVGTDSNLVQAFTMDDGVPDGIITRFTAPATHIVVSQDRKMVVCAGSDMVIRVHDTVAYKDTILTGHQAPVLSVAIDPKGEYVASSSCDGSVRVWNVKTSAIVASWGILPKTNNFSSSRTLCRLVWSLDGKFLCVPIEQEVRLYERNSWDVKHTLSDNSIKQTVSVVAISKCGQFLAGGCMDGVIIVWDVSNRQTVLSEQHPKSLPISGLAWNPSGKKEVAFVNVDGQLGTLENIDGDYIPSENKQEDSHSNGLSNGAVDGTTRSGDSDFPPLEVDMNDDDDDDDEFNISKIKSKLGFADDEEGTFIGLSGGDDLKGDEGSKAGDEDTASVVTTKAEPPPAPVMKLPEVQKPFQPGMSPEFLNDRYMSVVLPLLCEDPVPVINWLKQLGLLRLKMKCQSCRDQMSWTKCCRGKDGFVWKCQNRTCQRYKYSTSIRTGTFFANSNVSLQKWVHTIYLWSERIGEKAASRRLSISEKTMIGCYSLFRDVCTKHFKANPIQIGAPGNILEIGEFCVSHNARHQTPVWIFGIVDTSTEPTMGYLEIVQARDAATLLPIIDKVVCPGSIIHSEMNHSIHFLNPHSGVHTPTLHSYWNKYKRHIKVMHGCKRDFINSYLQEFMWHDRYSENALENFCKHIALQYKL